MSSEWTVQQALFCLAGSMVATLSATLGGYWAWVHYWETKIEDENNRIVSIVQTGPEREALKTVYLAELMGLSADAPVSLYEFDCNQAERNLLASPLIRSAIVRRMPPGAVYVDYEVRKPIATLADYKNIAIDEEGYLFPFTPFFSPKEIPEIYLGIPPFGALPDAMGRKGGEWLVPLKSPFLKLAFELLHFLEEAPWKEGFRVKRIDVSNAFAPSLGQREIVLFTEEERTEGEKRFLFPKILRIAPNDFRAQLTNFFVLRRTMEEAYRPQILQGDGGRFASRIIDLRIPQLAFVQN